MPCTGTGESRARHNHTCTTSRTGNGGRRTPTEGVVPGRRVRGTAGSGLLRLNWRLWEGRQDLAVMPYRCPSGKKTRFPEKCLTFCLTRGA